MAASRRRCVLPREVEAVLHTTRSQLRDIIMGWDLRELTESPEKTIQRIDRILGPVDDPDFYKFRRR